MKSQSPGNRSRSWPTAIALTLLTACAGTTSSGQPCGVLIPYSDETQDAASAELDALKLVNAYPHLRMMIEDYKTTRDTIRACK